MTKSKLLTLLLIVFAITISSCAHHVDKSCIISNNPDGFFVGFFNGFTIFFTFLIKIFNNDTLIYSIDNTGIGYDLGFILGISAYSSLLRSKAYEKLIKK